MNEYEWIHDWTSMLLKDNRELLLSFELIYFRNSFCYRIENTVKARELEPTIFRDSLAWFLTDIVNRWTCYVGGKQK